MDPNVALDVIRELVLEIRYAVQNDYPVVILAEKLADQVSDLDEWLAGGGFAPQAWRPAGGAS
jgi:hypothetical protein